HHPMMAGCRRMQFVDRLGRGHDRRGEAECDLRRLQVVVDRLRHADHLGTILVHEHLRDVHGAVAADDDQSVQSETPDGLVYALGTIDDLALATLLDRPLKRVAPIGRAEDRPALRQDSTHRLRRQVDVALVHQAFEAVKETHANPAILVAGSQYDGADNGVEAGTVAAAGENADSFDIFAHCFLFALRYSYTLSMICSISSAVMS